MENHKRYLIKEKWTQAFKVGIKRRKNKLGWGWHGKKFLTVPNPIITVVKGPWDLTDNKCVKIFSTPALKNRRWHHDDYHWVGTILNNANPGNVRKAHQSPRTLSSQSPIT